MSTWDVGSSPSPQTDFVLKVRHVPEFPPTKANRLCTGALFAALLSWFTPRGKYRAKGLVRSLGPILREGLGCD